MVICISDSSYGSCCCYIGACWVFFYLIITMSFPHYKKVNGVTSSQIIIEGNKLHTK